MTTVLPASPNLPSPSMARTASRRLAARGADDGSLARGESRRLDHQRLGVRVHVGEGGRQLP